MAFGPLCIPPSATGSQEQRPQEAQTLQNFIKKKIVFPFLSIYTFGHLSPWWLKCPLFNRQRHSNRKTDYIFKKVSKCKFQAAVDEQN